MPESLPRVVAVILNWNNYDDSADCIKSFQTLSYSALDLLLVDNGSTDGSGERLDEEFSSVDVHYTSENLGFAGGMNRGIEVALERGAEYVWLLNNDTLVADEHLLGNLVRRMDANPNVGILTPVVMRYPATDEVWFREGYLDWKSGMAGHVEFDRWYLPGKRDRGPMENGGDDALDDDLVHDGYLPFCSALIRTDVFEDVGLLAEEYFLYMEDIDYCAQVALAGYDIATDTTQRVYHKVGGTSGSTLDASYRARNLWLFFRRFRERIDTQLFVLSYCWWASISLLMMLVNRQFARMWAFFRGISDGLLGRSGEMDQ